MRFNDILPHLVDAYRRGILVPFIGSGMSVPACTGWQTFVEKLAGEAELPVPKPTKSPDGSESKFTPSEMYRLADKAVHRLRHKSVKERAEAYRRALIKDNSSTGQLCTVPPQTEALARLPWPLVLTTNYDDLYLQGRAQRIRVPEVLGRSIKDCHKVIRSLDEPIPPSLLWALQGFLGGQAARPEDFVEQPTRRCELVDQLVVGHQQYQNVINAQPHFRRAFAEVFHRRSFLFLGSGLVEDYLINLFGEIIHHYGPSPQPHFALVREDQKNLLEPQFLQTRLGIVPIFYGEHDELPDFLLELAERSLGSSAQTDSREGKSPVAWMMDEMGFSLTDGSLGPLSTACRVKLHYGRYGVGLPVPTKGSQECTISSVGRDNGNVPLEWGPARDLLEKSEAAGLVKHADTGEWNALDEAPSYVYRFGTSPIFGVCARSRNAASGESPDRRALGIIPDAVYAAMRAVDAAGFRKVNLGPVASGPEAIWHSLYPFVQTLVGIRQFFASTPGPCIQTLSLYVFEPAVWSAIVSGKISVSEILSSDVTKIWVEIRDAEGMPEIQSVTVRGPTTVGQLKDLCGLERARWCTKILPAPAEESVHPDSEDELDVAPTSIVVFSPRESRAGGADDLKSQLWGATTVDVHP
jgi:hypothetical protein